MKMKKFLALSTASVMALSMAACGSTDNGGAAESSVASTTPATAEASSEAAAPAEVTSLNYAELTLGEDYTDITTTIKVLTNRTDLLEDGAAVPFQTYIDAFNEMYPNITVDIEGITDYASDTLLRLQGGDWGDVMFIPAVDKADLSTYFLPLGTTTTRCTKALYTVFLTPQVLAVVLYITRQYSKQQESLRCLRLPKISSQH